MFDPQEFHFSSPFLPVRPSSVSVLLVSKKRTTRQRNHLYIRYYKQIVKEISGYDTNLFTNFIMHPVPKLVDY